MNTALEKRELIAWISQLKDAAALNQLLRIKKEASSGEDQEKPLHKFGCGRHIFTYVSDDFDDPLEDFKDYMKCPKSPIY